MAQRGSRRRPRGSLRPLNQIWRQYYSTRNYIHFMRSEFNNNRLARREARNAILRILKSWTQGPRYGLAFTTLQLRAVLDGYQARMGLTVPPVHKHSVRQ
jgi:hypothetical protein